MKSEISIVLSGVCGYGSRYLTWLQPLYEKYHIHLAGIVDLYYEKSPDYKSFVQNNIPCFRSLEDFYQTKRADLAIIATPIPFHKEHAALAMKNGSHVLCEKPAAAVYAHAAEMKQTSIDYNKCLAIGFQWSYQAANADLKADILKGIWGRAVELKTIVLWPRPITYYTGKGWTGKQFTADGRPIFDSIASNATSHYLHNMLFVLGDRLDTTATAASVEANLYRANQIETFDAIEARILTGKNTTLLHYAAHCIEDVEDPVLEYIFEKGVIRYSPETQSQLRGVFHNGETITYGSLANPGKGLETMVKAVAEEDFSQVPCTIDTALAHMQVMDRINARLDRVHIFNEEDTLHMTKDDKTFVIAKGMADRLKENFQKGILSGEKK